MTIIRHLWSFVLQIRLQVTPLLWDVLGQSDGGAPAGLNANESKVRREKLRNEMKGESREKECSERSECEEVRVYLAC